MKHSRLATIIIFIFASIVNYAKCPIDVFGKDAMSIGIYIEDIKSNDIVFDYQSNRVFTPASTTKALTTATVLSTLNENRTFKTPVYISGVVKNGTLYGNIVIDGVGDATIESKHFPEYIGFCDSIVCALKNKGITRIEGNCIINSKNQYNDYGVIPCWEIEDVAWGYGTGLYSFNYKDNVFNINITDTIITKPVIKDLNIIHVPNENGTNIDLIRGIGSNDLYLLGNVGEKGYSTTCSMPYPQDVFYDELVNRLASDGIELIQVEFEEENESPKELIYTHKSPPIKEILKSLMIRSDNLFAESLLRKISPENTLKCAIDRELNIWRDRGLQTSLITIRDGSGLARSNRISPKFMSDMLKWMYNSKYRDSYIECFPRSGINGTLKTFLSKSHLEGKLALKTGSMNGVQCYAGYKLDDNNEPTHTVVIMVNHFFCKRHELKKAIENFLINTFK